jgi:hypothetical protein
MIIILLTGKGKSLIFIRLAYLPQASVTIVIVLFYILEDNIITWYEEKGIKCLK